MTALQNVDSFEPAPKTNGRPPLWLASKHD